MKDCVKAGKKPQADRNGLPHIVEGAIPSSI